MQKTCSSNSGFKDDWVRQNVMQCQKCLKIWPMKTFLRKDGQEKATCPFCGSRQASWTILFPTKIVPREDLLMLTYGEYPRGLFPLTSCEELVKFPILAKEKDFKVFISRGWASPEYGHYVYLNFDKKAWMTTDEAEMKSMEES